MNTYLNYIVEANLSLLLFLGIYKLLLKGETNFSVMRIALLMGIFASLLFPLIHIQDNNPVTPLSLSQLMPSYWLPEVVIGGEVTRQDNVTAFHFWKYTTFIYATGLAIGLLIIALQLSHLYRIISRSKTYPLKRLRIVESSENKPTFSFFYFIFIGQANKLSFSEKQQIIQHESVHASQWHSFDIVILNILRILFWFNPFILTYKKIFIQLHEFEADARAIENSDMDKYCSLLARVALQSANFSFANHFNNSLTVKRIEMMRTIKTNIKHWKLAALLALVPVVFFFISCQDQIGDDLREISQNSTHALIAPAKVQERFEQLKKENPDKKYALIELNETASESLKKLEKTYGLPKAIEVFSGSEGNTGLPGMNGLSILSESDQSSYSEIRISETESKSTFAIIEFNEKTNEITNTSQENEVFTVVEEQPEFPGGYDSMILFIRQNLRYPAADRQKGVEGTVYVSFIVEKDGKVSEVTTIRGISQEADAEASRVIQLSPAWIPGKQNDEVVRVRFVIPIKFSLNSAK